MGLLLFEVETTPPGAFLPEIGWRWTSGCTAPEGFYKALTEFVYQDLSGSVVFYLLGFPRGLSEAFMYTIVGLKRAFIKSFVPMLPRTPLYAQDKGTLLPAT